MYVCVYIEVSYVCSYFTRRVEIQPLVRARNARAALRYDHQSPNLTAAKAPGIANKQRATLSMETKRFCFNIQGK